MASESTADDVVVDIDGVLSAEHEVDNDKEETSVIELVHVDEKFYYIEYIMKIAALLHSIVSFAMLIAYYHLKVKITTSSLRSIPYTPFTFKNAQHRSFSPIFKTL